MPDFRWDWIERHTDDIASATVEHLHLVAASVALAVVVAIPIAVLVRRRPSASAAATGGATILYTIPSLALFAILVSVVGIGRTPAIIGLAAYAVGVLLRNALTGLREVPPAALDAARGMGMTRRQMLFRVELPLAVPAILTGIRLATIETVAIATIAVFVAGGGLGELIFTDGIQRDLFLTPIVAGAVVAILMALVLDLLLLGAQRVIAPWRREART
jgi:osmoprotectant transport system permease protein